MSTVCAKVTRRLATVTHAVGVTIDTRTDDDGDRLMAHTDALGAATRLRYDATGRRVSCTTDLSQGPGQRDESLPPTATPLPPS